MSFDGSLSYEIIFQMNFIPLRTLAIWSKLSIETTDESSEDLYDPTKALNSAIIDWLPQFSSSENCTTEIPLIIRGDNNLESMEIEVRWEITVDRSQ